MSRYIVRAERVSVREIEVEADSPEEAHAKVSSMNDRELDGHAEDDHHWQFDWNAERLEEAGNVS